MEKIIPKLRLCFLSILLAFIAPHLALAFSAANYSLSPGVGIHDKFAIWSAETSDEKELRKKYQNEYIEEVASEVDVFFLQEVNSVLRRPNQWAENTGRDLVSSVDNCGVKLAEWGSPERVYLGLAILANPDYELTKIASHTLSGSGFILPSVICLQSTERRIALFALITTPQYGRVLLVNVHLQPSFTLTPAYKEFLKKKFDEGKLDSQEHEKLVNLAHRASRIKRGELKKLAQHINEYKEKYMTTRVIVSGNFNVDAYHPEKGIGQFEEITDLSFPLDESLGFYSWWPEKNTNRKYIVSSVSTLLEIQPDLTKNMHQTLKEKWLQKRQIDFMYFSKIFLDEKKPLFVPLGVDVEQPYDRHLSNHFGFLFQL